MKAAFEINLEFYEGMPDEEGWYIVKLKSTKYSKQEYDVDYCRISEITGGSEWRDYFEHNVSHYAKIE
jgi:hypothetical protein